ncbi:hypothetical protein AGMMS49525_04790 [Bacteroidia bacterium]|nr:hypothetical protein AGMMS49525_04790 [Bacteroidia bacterium]
MNEYENKYRKYLFSSLSEIEKLYNDLVDKIVVLVSGYVEVGEWFEFSKHKLLNEQVNKLIESEASKVTASISYSIGYVWDISNKKNTALTNKVLSKLREIPEKYLKTNQDVLDAFLTRKVRGLRLSERVWNYNESIKTEIEKAINASLSEGKSAAQLSRDVRKYLNNPDALFRRVRDVRGNLKLSASALAYQPGKGVYRSAYKNAMRLARTEINKAYHIADNTRWKQLDFVIGYRVHTTDRKFNTCDLCTELQGLYPKDFVFTFWHPQCLCYVTPELITTEQMTQLNRSILYGEPEPDIEQPELPANFKKYYENVKDNIKDMQVNKRPDFYLENEKLLKSLE